MEVSKTPASVDPRDWLYMREWQRWGDAVPPWNWRFQLAGYWVNDGVPPLAAGAVMQKNYLTNHAFSAYWKYDWITPAVPPVPEVVFSQLLIYIIVDPEEDGLLDGDGNPYTFTLFCGGYNLANSNFEGFINRFKPAYNEQFTVPLRDVFGDPHVDFPTGLIATPVAWQTPTWVDPHFP